LINDVIEKEKYKARLRTCVTCNAFEEETFICNQCGCNVALKAFYKQTTCPLEKWTKQEAGKE